MSFYIGLDLGQVQDYTGLVILEKLGAEDGAELHVRHIERPPLGTYYTQVASRLKEIVEDDRLKARHYDPESMRACYSSPSLVVDSTGVGRAVVDLLRKEGLPFTAVTITGGDAVHYVDGTYRVPKRDLVAAVQVPLQSRRLKIAEGLELAETLKQELLNFRVKVNTSTAHDSYEAWREGDHDDLVLATGLACWEATRPGPVMTFV
jgi:hypothetical protein